MIWRAEDCFVNTQKTPRPGSVPYAAQRLGCTAPVVYAYIKSGKLRHYRVSMRPGSKGDIRITNEAIADCIAELEREAAQMVH